jgi:prepilin-type N-terminal cleavage/methylation domain-containing protein
MRCDGVRARAPRSAASSATRARDRAGSAGFSLLEVLGAIAILGIWFAVIAELAMVGLRAEGRSHRMLMASLVADDVLSEIEIEMMSGRSPEVSSEEEERDGYTIRIDIEPYELELPAPEAKPGAPTPVDPATGPFKYLRGSQPDAQSPILSIRIQVAWPEGHDEGSVTRYTFGTDLTAAGGSLGALQSAPGPSDDRDVSGDLSGEL